MGPESYFQSSHCEGFHGKHRRPERWKQWAPGASRLEERGPELCVSAHAQQKQRNLLLSFASFAVSLLSLPLLHWIVPMMVWFWHNESRGKCGAWHHNQLLLFSLPIFSACLHPPPWPYCLPGPGCQVTVCRRAGRPLLSSPLCLGNSVTVDALRFGLGPLRGL